MTRYARTIDIMTGAETLVPFTQEEEAAADAAYEHEQANKQLPDLLPYQFWAMVEISGKRNALDTFANSLPGNQKIIAKAKLEHTLSFRRDNPLVEAARQGIGLTKEELDALWLQAAAL
jgi:hypothetical protein